MQPYCPNGNIKTITMVIMMMMMMMMMMRMIMMMIPKGPQKGLAPGGADKLC